jgi:penicillin-binding protein 1A
MIYPRHLTWPQSRPHSRPKSRGVARPVVEKRTTWSRKKIIKTVLASVALAVLTILTFCGAAVTLMMLRIRHTLPSITKIALFQPSVGTRIYSSDGVLLATLQIENRQPVPLSAVSPKLVDAIIAVEDSRFFEHHGIDYRGVGRAAFANLINRDVTGQGGSTITQQLARNVSDFGLSKEKSLERKLREAMVAVRIEQVFDKKEILDLYLNQIYFGSGAYGVEAAAKTYFGKSAKKLTLAEAALLAGLPQRPLAYSPYTNKRAAIERRNVVLRRMLDTGKIDQVQYEAAKCEPLKTVGRRSNHTVYRAPYFVDWVVQDLVKRHGVDAVYSGWKVVTTLDWKMQQAAERVIRTGLSYGATQGALVCIDPHNGDVRAMVGGLDYKKDQFNAVTQGRRQPGSAFKPIVYAAALDMGSVTLDTPIKDEPLKIPSGDRVWTVHNYGGGYSNKDEIVFDGIRRSTNTIAVQVAEATGIPTIIQYAQRLGISTELAPYLPLALGASAVRPIELCAAYGTFAAQGDRYEPTGVRSIKDNFGADLQQPSTFQRKKAALLQTSTIDDINTALWAVVHEGTGTAAAGVPNAFGKTGTTSDHRDAWFVGYTPELVTAVWVASPFRAGNGVVKYRPMHGATGGRVAAPIWARFMKSAVPLQRKVNRARGLTLWGIRHLPPPKPVMEVELADSAQGQDAGGPSAENAWMRDLYRYQGSSGGSTRDYNYSSQRATWEAPQERWSGQQADYGLREARAGSVVAEPEAELVSVCADSGRLATDWCPTTVLLNVTAGRAPTNYCRIHHAPQGEW